MDAMYLGKCVVIGTDGPGASDVLTHGKQIWVVPPEDPAILRDAIQYLCDNDKLRVQLARTGQAYAQSMGDEKAWIQRVLATAVTSIFTKTKN